MLSKMCSNSYPLVLRLLSSSISVSKQAGNIIRDVMRRGDLGIVEKGVNDLQTEADRSAQTCIIASLSRQFPKISIIGEEVNQTLDLNDKVNEEWIIDNYDDSVFKHKCPEEFVNVKDEDIVVWVDPLDGTSEYTQGLLDHVTVLIGLSVKGKAIAGVIHQPYYNYQIEKDTTKLGRTMWGLIGLGAFGIKHVLPEQGKCFVTTTRSHSNQIINAAVEAVNPDEVLRVGGAGHKVILVIEGKAHAYIFASRGCKKWDTCAPEALLHSVGGKLTDIIGDRLWYDRDVNITNELGVLATYDAMNAHQKFVDKIPDDIKIALRSKAKQ